MDKLNFNEILDRTKISQNIKDILIDFERKCANYLD